MSVLLGFIYKLISLTRKIWTINVSDTHGRLASFTQRAFAYITDYLLLLFITMYIVQMLVEHYHQLGVFTSPIEQIMQINGKTWDEAWFILKLTLINGISSTLQFIVRPVYYIFCEGKFGWTIGKRIFGCRVVDEQTHDLIGLKQANKRYWMTLLSHITLFTGFLSMIPNKFNQTLHDRRSQTVVLNL